MSEQGYKLQATYYAAMTARQEMQSVADRLRQIGETGLATDADFDAQKWEEREKVFLRLWNNERARTETPQVKHDSSFP